MSETTTGPSTREVAIRARIEAITAALDAADIDLGEHYTALALLRVAAELYVGTGRPHAAAEALGNLKEQLHRLSRQAAGHE